MATPGITTKNNKKRIAIFASGAGSNAQKIINHFTSPPTSRKIGMGSLQIERRAKVVLVVCNKPDAGVIKIAERENISFLLIDKKKFNADGYLPELENYNIDFIVLAGFLLKLPDVLIQSYHNKIINIHPALLPKYGGKGMFGSKVHEAVINSQEVESGITIHYVDEIYDHGTIIFQAKCKVDADETVETLAEKIHALEHKFYPVQIEKIIND